MQNRRMNFVLTRFLYKYIVVTDVPTFILGYTLVSSKFGLGCLGFPCNPELRKVLGYYLPAQAKQGEGKGLEGLPENPLASRPPRARLSQLLGMQRQAPPSPSVGSAQARGFASCEGGQGRSRRCPGRAQSEGDGPAAGLHHTPRGKRSWAWGNRISSPPGRGRSGHGRTRPPLWRGPASAQTEGSEQ